MDTTITTAYQVSTRHLLLMGLDVSFFSTVALLAHASQLPPVTPTNLLLFGLATVRMARTLSFNEIAEPIRAPFTEVKADSCGAGANVHARGDGLQYVIGSLLACPICTGTWSALLLVIAWSLLPFGQMLVWVLAIASISEILHWFIDLGEWSGRAARVYSGHVSPDRE